ncbi:ubiquitin-conjugating enzyme [Terfezia boudieri ATCC MYA-4762]|uniref:Ubiquitin-conjugating enzyme E2 2 n=1 Tax=Terfezia boudieri ATCC MYA-4762 TaxID=1051890 RepID=A0A3N4LSZ3_9PEZI|nr:ubiquitin-conjugating enzyme [Terfezia boudieri ATCC MYA-4762]
MSASALLLYRQFKGMQTDTNLSNISVGLIDENIYEWEVMLMIPDECNFYGGGCFKARLSFPKEYPLMPPKMRFETPIWHPNIYPQGDVCISILHPPVEDKYGYELVQERWLPIHTPESILISVISMLSSPNIESPANVDAARQWRDDQAGFKANARKSVRASLEMC